MPRIYIPPNRAAEPEDEPIQSPKQSPKREKTPKSSPRSSQPSPQSNRPSSQSNQSSSQSNHPSPRGISTRSTSLSIRQSDAGAQAIAVPLEKPAGPLPKPAHSVYRQPAARNLFTRIKTAIPRRSIQSVQFGYDEPPPVFRVIENDYHLYNDCTTSEASSSVSTRSEVHVVPRTPSPVEPLPVISQDDIDVPIMSLRDEESQNQSDTTSDCSIDGSEARSMLEHVDSPPDCTAFESEQVMQECAVSENDQLTMSTGHIPVAGQSVRPSESDGGIHVSEPLDLAVIPTLSGEQHVGRASSPSVLSPVLQSIISSEPVSQSLSLELSPLRQSHDPEHVTDSTDQHDNDELIMSHKDTNFPMHSLALNDGGGRAAQHALIHSDPDTSSASHTQHSFQQPNSQTSQTHPESILESSSILHAHGERADDTSMLQTGALDLSIKELATTVVSSPSDNPESFSSTNDDDVHVPIDQCDMYNSPTNDVDSQCPVESPSPSPVSDQPDSSTTILLVDDASGTADDSIDVSEIQSSAGSTSLSQLSDDDVGIPSARKWSRIRRIASDEEDDPIVESQNIQPLRKRVQPFKPLLDVSLKPAAANARPKPTMSSVTGNKRKAKTIEKYSLSSSDEQYSLSSDSEHEYNTQTIQRQLAHIAKPTHSKTRAQNLSALTGISSSTAQPLSRVFHRISLLQNSNPLVVPLLPPATQLLEDWDEITSFIVKQLQIHQLSFTSLIQYSLEDLTGLLETYKQSTGSESLTAIASSESRLIIAPVYFLYLLRLCLDSLLNCGISVANTHWNFIRRGQTASMLYTLSKTISPPKPISDIPLFSSLMDRVSKGLSSAANMVRHDFEHGQDSTAAYHLALLVDELRRAAEEKKIENSRVLIIASNHIATHTDFIKQAWHTQAVDTTGKLWLWKKKRKRGASVCKWFESSSAVLVCAALLETQFDLVPWDQVYDVVFWSSAVVELELSEQTQQKLIQHSHVKFHHFVVRPESKALLGEIDAAAKEAVDTTMTIESKLAELEDLVPIPRGAGPARVFMMSEDSCLMVISWCDLAEASAANQRAIMEDWISEINSCAWYSNHCYCVLMDVPLIMLAHRQHERNFVELYAKCVADSNPIQSVTFFTLPFEPHRSRDRFNHLETVVASLVARQSHMTDVVPVDSTVDAQSSMSTLRCMNPRRSRLFSSMRDLCSLSLAQLAQRLNKDVSHPTVKSVYNELHADFRLG